jgi:hypothetical protein
VRTWDVEQDRLTDVRWLPPTRANIARTLVTIPAGFRRFFGPPGGQ